jgi:transposase
VISKIKWYIQGNPETIKPTGGRMKDTVKYMGIDVHTSSCSFCVLGAQGTVIDQRDIVTNGRLIIEYVQSFGKDLTVTFEECGLSSWLYDLLHKRVSQVIVCNPAANASYKHAKTDKLDAMALAQLLRGGFLREVFHDASNREKLRVLVSSYEDLVSDMVRIKNRLEDINKRIHLSKEDAFFHHATFIKESLEEQLKPLEKTKHSYQQKLEVTVKKFKETKYLVTIPGIKYIQASKIIARVVNPMRFKNKHKFFAYCGLVRHKRISNQRLYGTQKIFGDNTLKCIFNMAANSALKGDGALRDYYDFLRTKGTSDKNARNAMARKIAALTLSVWRNNQKFNGQKILDCLPAKV